MTCIVGLAQGGHVWLGGDSAGISGWSLTLRADEKVFRNGPFLMGFTTSYRMGQLLRYGLKPPEHPEGVDVDRYMATTFVDAVRECLKDGGFAKKSSEQEEGGTFIVGYRGGLFTVHDDYQVARRRDSFAAIGCGFEVALGALHASRAELDADYRVRLALEAAERFSAGVRGPFVILNDACEHAASAPAEAA